MKFRWYLWPLAWIYGCVVYLRNCFFDWKWIKSCSFTTAVISVGNITVGGTGKTPHVEYLLTTLQQHFKVAMVSRGYKRKSRGMQVASAQSTCKQLGDEPYQIHQKFPQVQVVADAQRCRAIQYIESQQPTTQVVVLDDAFQHRYVEPGMSILLVDYHRLITKDKLLPVGNLRESAANRYRASVIIVTKCPPTIQPIELRNLYNEMQPRPYQRIFYTYYQYASLKPLYSQIETVSLVNAAVLLVTGVAQPQPMVDYLLQQGAHVSAISFPDHHDFTAQNWKVIEQRFQQLSGTQKIMVITEKDAARIAQSPCVPAALQSYIWVLPIKVCFLQDRAKEFNQYIIDYVSKNKRNSDFFGR